MSKGQMEIFGLVIIVILVSMGLLFAIIVLTKPPSQSVQELKESMQAANLVNSILGTTSTGCSKRTVRELMQDCALASFVGGRIIGASVCEDGSSTCDKADYVITTLLEETLGQWGKTYEFFITGTETASLVNASNGKCLGEREGVSRPEKIRTGIDVNVTLYVC